MARTHEWAGPHRDLLKVLKILSAFHFFSSVVRIKMIPSGGNNSSDRFTNYKLHVAPSFVNVAPPRYARKGKLFGDLGIPPMWYVFQYPDPPRIYNCGGAPKSMNNYSSNRRKIWILTQTKSNNFTKMCSSLSYTLLVMEKGFFFFYYKDAKKNPKSPIHACFAWIKHWMITPNFLKINTTVLSSQ